MEQKTKNADQSLGTVEKAIDLLFHLHGAEEPCGVTSIGRALVMPKSSVHRLLTSLCRRGLVEHDARGRYRPGIALVALGLGVLEAEPIVAVGRSILERHARALGETFFLVTARAGQLVVLAKAEGPGFLRAAPRVGSVVPAHATAVGKLYRAFAPDLLSPDGSEPRRFTDDTLTSEAALAAEIERAHTEGVARNRDEWISGLSVWAAPVFRGARMVGAAAVAGATPRMDELAARARSDVRVAAGEIASRLEGVAS